MNNILQVTIKAYEENIDELSKMEIPAVALDRYLPSADDSTVDMVHSLVNLIPLLSQEFVSFIEDTDRLPEDKALAIAAINYLLMPFDAIADTEENGLLGLLDDAVVFMDIVDEMKCPSPVLEKILVDHRLTTDTLRNAMHDWLGESIDNFLEQVGGVTVQKKEV